MKVFMAAPARPQARSATLSPHRLGRRRAASTRRAQERRFQRQARSSRRRKRNTMIREGARDDAGENPPSPQHASKGWSDRVKELPLGVFDQIFSIFWRPTHWPFEHEPGGAERTLSPIQG